MFAHGFDFGNSVNYTLVDAVFHSANSMSNCVGDSSLASRTVGDGDGAVGPLVLLGEVLVEEMAPFGVGVWVLLVGDGRGRIAGVAGVTGVGGVGGVGAVGVHHGGGVRAFGRSQRGGGVGWSQVMERVRKVSESGGRASE